MVCETNGFLWIKKTNPKIFFVYDFIIQRQKTTRLDCKSFTLDIKGCIAQKLR